MGRIVRLFMGAATGAAFVIIVLVSAIWLTDDLRNGDQDAPSTYREAQSHSPRIVPPIAPGAHGFGNSGTSDQVPRESADNAENGEQYFAKADLDAQRSMARSTVQVVYATWFMAVLTAFGVYLIYRTLLYTRQAAVDTGVAARAAEGAVDEARRTTLITSEQARLTLRADIPYVYLAKLPEIARIAPRRVPSRRTLAVISLENFGRTAAIIKRVRYGHSTASDLSRDVAYPQDVRFEAPVRPNDIATTKEKVWIEWSAAEMDAINSGSGFWLYAAVEYVDYLGTRYDVRCYARWSGPSFAEIGEADTPDGVPEGYWREQTKIGDG
ncbi:hypothetical protein [Aurantimonas marianensis]|uniref:Uncharacterized protein n=1 Tax=Aurantimonas marianensis TaxID=2920428 RepID=A0A9X2KFY7_9HYPH|nr:hypothetical protein [Aurantimonas marianensis]MCP3056978.1 hypothetical protein [Aurantimonas marianensis]